MGPLIIGGGPHLEDNGTLEGTGCFAEKRGHLGRRRSGGLHEDSLSRASVLHGLAFPSGTIIWNPWGGKSGG
jgi:hypothetical protein